MIMLHTGFYRDGAHLSSPRLSSAGCKSLGFPGIDWCLCRKHEPHWVCQYYGLLPDKTMLRKCLWWPSGVINISIGWILERLLSSTTQVYMPAVTSLYLLFLSSHIPIFWGSKREGGSHLFIDDDDDDNLCAIYNGDDNNDAIFWYLLSIF